MNEKQRQTAVVILVAGCTFLFLFKVLPVLMSLGLSFKEYQPFKGYFGSPWVGLKNFNQVFSMPNTVRIFFNALRINLFTVLLALPIAGVFTYCASRIRNRTLAFLLTVVFALASVFPQVIFAGFAAFALGIDINASYDIVYSLFEAVRLSGFVALGAFFMSTGSNYSPGNRNSLRLTLTVLAVALLAGASKFLTSDFELASVMQNPLIYDRTEVIDTFYYKASIMQMRFGVSSALWLMKYISELVMGALAAAGVFLVLKSANKKKFNKADTAQNSAFAPVVCTVMAAAVAALCVIALIPKAAAPINIGSINIGMNVMLIAGSPPGFFCLGRARGRFGISFRFAQGFA